MSFYSPIQFSKTIKFNLVVCVAALTVVSGCATSNVSFLPYRGTQSVFKGSGGTVRQLKGIDVWENGDPDRKFKLIGIIEQIGQDSSSRRLINLNITGQIKSGIQESELVDLVKKNNGDALVLISKESKISGLDGQDVSYGFDKKFAVIKYLPE